MEQPFMGHVHELRQRLLRAVVVVAAGAAVGYIYNASILAWLRAPLGQTLYYSDVTGAFNFVVKICLLTGLLVAAPVITYQLVAFVRPALPRPIYNRSVLGFVAGASALMVGGMIFGYYVTLPPALHFLGQVDPGNLHPLIAANSYLNFVMAYLAVFAVVFLLPLFAWAADHIRPIPPAALMRARKWVILGAFSAALFLPIAPDPLSQCVLALPIVVLYEVSVWMIWARDKGRQRARRRIAASRDAMVPRAVAAAANIAAKDRTSQPRLVLNYRGVDLRQ